MNNDWGLKKQCFWNNSGKPQPVRTKYGRHAQDKGQQGSGNFGCDQPSRDSAGGSSDESGVRRSRGFSLCIYATVAATYTLIVPTAGSVYCVQ